MRKALGCLASVLLSALPAQAETALAEIRITPSDTGVVIEGIVVGLSTATVDAALRISKRDPAGSSDLSQARTVEIARGQRETIGRTNLSIQDGGELSVTMTVTEDGIEIASAQSRFGPKRKD